MMSGQKLIKNAKNGSLPDRSILIGQKLVENAKIQMRHIEQFSNNELYPRWPILSRSLVSCFATLGASFQ